MQPSPRSGLIPASQAPSRRRPHWKPRKGGASRGPNRASTLRAAESTAHRSCFPAGVCRAVRAPTAPSQAASCTRADVRGEHRERLEHRSHLSAELIHFLSLWVCLFWMSHVSGINKLSSCVWLLSLSIVFSRFIHVAAYVSASLLFMAELILPTPAPALLTL